MIEGPQSRQLARAALHSALSADNATPGGKLERPWPRGSESTVAHSVPSEGRIPFSWIIALLSFSVGVGGAYLVNLARSDSARLKAIVSMERTQSETAELREQMSLQLAWRKEREAERRESAEIDESLLADLEAAMDNSRTFDAALYLQYLARRADAGSLTDDDLIAAVADAARRMFDDPTLLARESEATP